MFAGQVTTKNCRQFPYKERNHFKFIGILVEFREIGCYGLMNLQKIMQAKDAINFEFLKKKKKIKK